MSVSGSSTFKLRLCVPKQVLIQNSRSSRDEFFEWAWAQLASHGLCGVHEGTVLTADAEESGLSTGLSNDTWAVDAAEAPRERDWVSRQEIMEAELYFTSLEEAIAASEFLEAETNIRFSSGDKIVEQKPEDWDAKWKASFLGSGRGVTVPPLWRILPPWVTDSQAGLLPTERAIRINPGAGFGTGTHETTQLCLQAIAECRASGRVLDFGSGSGILSIGAALLGSEVDGVEVDPLAIDNARANAELNHVEDRIHFYQTLPEDKYRCVIANILRPVLVEFAAELVRRIEPSLPSDSANKNPRLILSGLIESDVKIVSDCYGSLLGNRFPIVRALGDWRALIWA